MLTNHHKFKIRFKECMHFFCFVLFIKTNVRENTFSLCATIKDIFKIHSRIIRSYVYVLGSLKVSLIHNGYFLEWHFWISSFFINGYHFKTFLLDYITRLKYCQVLKVFRLTLLRDIILIQYIWTQCFLYIFELQTTKYVK